MTISTRVLTMTLLLGWIFHSPLATPVYAQLDTLSHDGLIRDYFVHVPSSYDGSSPTPVVLAFHGGFGSAENIERQSGLSDVSDEEGFLVVYPNGTGTIQTWNGGECCGSATIQNIDDVGFIRKLIDRVESDYIVAPDQIYATGISNGAAMTYRLACELSDKIAAIGPVAATYRNQGCNPDRPVPVVHFHSEVDSNVPIQGGVGDGPSNLDWIALDSTLTNFAEYNSCASRSSETVSSSLTVTTWSGCTGGEAVKYYRTSDGGHSWPGGTKTIIGDTVSTAVDASREMWNFFKQFTITNVSTQAPPEPRMRQINVTAYPNPTRTFVSLDIGLARLSTVHVRIYNMLGQQVDSVQRTPPLPGTHQIDVDMKDLPAGVYLFQVVTQSGSKSLMISKL